MRLTKPLRPRSTVVEASRLRGLKDRKTAVAIREHTSHQKGPLMLLLDPPIVLAGGKPPGDMHGDAPSAPEPEGDEEHPEAR